MNPVSQRKRHRILDPEERIAEVLFGLIMVLSFTGSLSVADAGRDDVRTMRVSNCVAIVMLFIAGLVYGKCIGRSPWFAGLLMVVLGASVVAMTIALGG